MFNNLGNQPAGAAGDNSVDDIFAETDASVAHPVSGASIQTQAAGLSAPRALVEGEDAHAGRSGIKIKFVLIIVLVALILGAAAYLAYSKFMRSAAESDLLPSATTTADKPSNEVVVTPPVNNVVVPEPEPIVPNPEPVVNTNVATSASGTTVVTAPVDSDGDSLTDLEEKALNTNINLIDSDFDGLSDYEEVKIYLTNPINPDTDADGFNDGDEVKSGYNPKGSGKL
jgi:hypothetical protein